MRASNAQANFSDDRQREHQRQQERLKAMAASSDKAPMVSADLMIENLLKDSFKKSPLTTFSVSQVDALNSELPSWLQCESSAVPAQYKYLWSLVQSTLDLADTQKVSQLLLTSGLQVDILGFIWNLANKKIPGQLTKQEFYIVLALVGLAQTGYTFSNLSVLKLITVPSIPVLQVSLQKHPAPHSYVSPNSETTNSNSFKELPSSSPLQPKPFINLYEGEKDKNYLDCSAINEMTIVNDFKNLSTEKENSNFNEMQSINNNTTLEPPLIEQNRELNLNTNFPCIGSSPTAELEDDFSAFQSVPVEKNKDTTSSSQPFNESKDDFTEFQSANVEPLDPFETVVITQKREIPKIPLPKSFSGKFTNLKSNILKISPETEKKLKVLSPAESLSSLPESKISSSNKVSTSLSVLGSNHIIGSRLANHSISSKLDKPKCHRHYKIKLNPISVGNSNSEDEIILGVKPRNLESVIPKCRPKNSSVCKTFVLKETKIRGDETSEPSLNNPVEFESELDTSAVQSGKNTRQIEIPMLGTFNETVLPAQSKAETSGFDLIAVQEDKYSALRDIELALSQDKNSDSKEVNDDFGDFLSADIPVSSGAEFSGSDQMVSANSDSACLEKEEKETADWGNWNFNCEFNQDLSKVSDLDALQTNSISDLNETSTLKEENDLFDSFNLLDINDECNNQVSQPDSFVQNRQDYFGNDTKGSNVSDIIIIKDKNERSDDLSTMLKMDQPFNSQSENELWEFSTSDIKPLSEENISRHSSLPSLDLKISPSDESEQETVWRKCFDTCYNLIQDGHEIFNSINTKSVLDEVFAAPKTEDYLNNLNIAYQISKRVAQNFNSISPTQDDLEKFWLRLQDLCFEYNIKLKHDEDNFSEGKLLCSICLRRIGYNVINQGSTSYHPSCANLWINCVEPNLPFSI